MSLPDIALSRRAHDRIAGRRVDADWLQNAWADPATRVLPVAGTRLRVEDGRVGWVSPAQAPEGTRVLLGERDSVVHFAVLAAPELAETGTFVPIRAALPSLGEDGELVVHAVGLAEWHWAYRHCPRCGHRLTPAQEGHVLQCPGCGREQFPRTDPAVIMVVVHGQGQQERCLLGRQPSWPPGRYSTLAGFVEPGESLEHAVRREVDEETGVRVGRVDYVGSQPWPLPSSLMLGFVAHAESTEIAVDGEEIEDARWFTRDQMRAEAEAGRLLLPSGISISRTLIEGWYGAPLPGTW